jgi:hypothetical protein
MKGLDWTAVLAFATFLLAAATVWFALEARAAPRETTRHNSRNSSITLPPIGGAATLSSAFRGVGTGWPFLH